MQLLFSWHFQKGITWMNCSGETGQTLLNWNWTETNNSSSDNSGNCHKFSTSSTSYSEFKNKENWTNYTCDPLILWENFWEWFFGPESIGIFHTFRSSFKQKFTKVFESWQLWQLIGTLWQRLGKWRKMVADLGNLRKSRNSGNMADYQESHTGGGRLRNYRVN